MAPLQRTPPQQASPNGRAGNHVSSFDVIPSQELRSEYAETLDRTGITRQTANRWQQLANVPTEQFERHLKDPDTKPTTNGILRAANGSQRMDDGSLWVWGRLRDFERDGHLQRNAADFHGRQWTTLRRHQWS